MDDVTEIGKAVVAANREGRVDELLDRHYAENAESVEAAEMEGMGRIAHGLDQIRGKHEWWQENMEMHSAEVEGPFVLPPDRFAVIYQTDATNKKTGERMTGREVAVYHVQEGKVVREEFFYGGMD